MGGDDQIFENLLLFHLEQARIDIRARQHALATERHLHQAAARLSGDRHLVEFRLHVLHAALHLLHLLHHGANIFHRASQSFSVCESSTGAGVS